MTLSEHGKTPEQITDEDYKVAPTSADTRKRASKRAATNSSDESSASEDTFNEIRAPGPEEQYSEIVSGRDLKDGLSKQQTCKECGLTARNKEELKSHVRSVHKVMESDPD